jgi:hypothetical protein
MAQTKAPPLEPQLALLRLPKLPVQDPAIPLKSVATVVEEDEKSFCGKKPRSTPVMVSLVEVSALPPPIVIDRVAEVLPTLNLYVAPGQLVDAVPQFVKMSWPLTPSAFAAKAKMKHIASTKTPVLKIFFMSDFLPPWYQS